MDIGFFLKKMIAYFLEPFGMVVALLIVGLFFLLINKHKYSKIFLSLSVCILCLYSYPPFANLLVENLENKYSKYDYKSNIKYIHVLGSGHNVDPEQPLSSQVGGASIKRDIEGIIIHSQIEDSLLIFTGYGGSTDIPTAVMNADLALALGVKAENILVNGLPKDTMEEALYTKSIVGEENFILVTSASHMPRAMMLFESLGMHPIAAPTNFAKNEFDGYLIGLSLGAFHTSQIAVHEYLGILWAKLRGVANI